MVQALFDSGVGSAKPCRIFVSYAHADQRDGQWPELVVRELKNLVRILQAEGYEFSPEQIFYDHERLSTVEQWTSAIEQALDQCELFILLVSSASVASEYCIPVELRKAVERKIPITTVLLRPTANWIRQPVPGSSSGLQLGKFHSGGLPKGPDNNVKPLSGWADPAEGLKQMADELSEYISSFLPRQRFNIKAGTSVLKFLSNDHIDHNMRPYFCNQAELDAEFRKGAVLWHRHPTAWILVTLYRGCHYDGLKRLAQRMRFKHLKSKVGPIASEMSFEWPVLGRGAMEWYIVDIVDNILRALGGSLDFTADELQEAANKLGEIIKIEARALHLTSELPDVNPESIAMAIKMFLEFLELVPVSKMDSPNCKIMLDLFLEPKSWDQSVRLIDVCKMPTPKSAFLLELPQPEQLTEIDIDKWRRDHVSDDFNPDDLMGLLKNKLPMHHRVFANLIDSLLTDAVKR